MARVLSPIGFKIFGASACLLVMMVDAAAWSAGSTAQVHRQLETLELSLFPLAGTLAKLQHVVQFQKVTADYLTQTPTTAAVATCLAQARSQANTTGALLSQARTYQARGASIAVLERNKLALARLEPMIDELAFQESRLSRMTLAACARDAAAAQLEETRIQADQVYRLAEAIALEIAALVETDARIVAENQKIAQRANLIMICSAALVGLMLAWVVSRGLTRPIDNSFRVALRIGSRPVVRIGATLRSLTHKAPP